MYGKWPFLPFPIAALIHRLDNLTSHFVLSGCNKGMKTYITWYEEASLKLEDALKNKKVNRSSTSHKCIVVNQPLCNKIFLFENKK